MSLKPLGTMAALLGPDLKVALQLKWAIHLAKARRMDLLFLQSGERREDNVTEIPLDAPPGKEAAGAVREVMRIVEESPELRAGPRGRAGTVEEGGEKESHVIHVRLKQIHYTSLRSLRRLVLAEVG